MTGNDYLHILRSAPALLLFLRPDDDFTIVDASDAYLRQTYTVREEVIGQGIFSVFPDDPADPEASGVRNLRSSLERVRALKREDAMPIQKYAVRRPESEGGGFEERWWHPQNAPVLDANGEVEFIIHRVDDATEIVRLKRAEERARARAERGFRATEILDSITEGFFALDREWRFTYLNREGRLLLGRQADRALGRSVWEALPGLEGTGFEDAFRHAMDDRDAAAITAHYPGHDRWYDAHVYPSPDGISIYLRDVTAQREGETERQRIRAQAEQQRRVFETALANIPDLVYIFGLDHRFVFANEPLLNVWGVTREQAIGKTCLELGYPAWEAQMHDREIDEVIASRKPIQGEVPFEGATGRRYWDYIFAPVFGPEGDVIAVAGTARDTTDRRIWEESIASQSALLHEADRAKDEFLATLAHELRNPLAPLRNSVHLLRMRPAADETTVRIHEMMARQVDHLVRLVDDLLEISRVTRGDFALRTERVDLATVIRNALETCEPIVRVRRHQLRMTLPAEPLWVDADPVRLAQVVANLLDNAAKYTPPGGNIELAAGVEDGSAVVRVRDDGMGIAPDAVHRVFEMFNRGGRAELQGDGGLGIGLALARRLAQMHGATLDVASDGVGRGSVFTLRHPLAGAAAVASAVQPTRPAPDLKALRVLVVDDNRDAADSLGMLLEQLGAHVRIVHNGIEAIEAYSTFQPSAVLLDIGMPGMDGYEVARKITTLDRGRRAPLIAVTGWGQQQDRERAAAAGFDHHIVKPADIDVLKDLLAAIG